MRPMGAIATNLRSILPVAAVAVFCVWVFSQFLYRFAHGGPYDLVTAWRYVSGFTIYMIAPWAVTLFIALCGYILGRFFFALILKNFKFHDNLEETIFCIGTGLGLITIITFLLGLMKLLYPALFLALAIFTCGLGYRHIVNLYKTTWTGIKSFRCDFLDGILLLLASSFILNTFFIPNNPSTGFDPINSHLCAPKYYLRDNAITFFPWINFNNFPQVQEMLLTLEMMVHPDPGSSMMFFYMVITAFAVYMIGSRYFGRTVGLMSAVFFLSIENVYLSSIRAFVENIMGFYVVLLIHAFLRWHERRDIRWAVITGIIGGLACGVKYTSAVSVLVILILMALARFLPMKKSELDLLGTEFREPEKEPEKSRGVKKKKKAEIKPNIAQSRNSIPVTIEPEKPPDVHPGGIGKSLWLAFIWTVLIASPWYLR
ncbi:MAG TPA: phospholipid carrier-dependent glycosyltransferase, partial [Firmicutes bacterium]|nr:phospholipid carrier-dependent glycosyltransferase [Bacillota bacterium]